MFSIPHLIIVFVVALVVFGPEKLPELARNLGKLMGEFRRATGDLRSTFEGHLRDLEREADQRRLATDTATATAPMYSSTSNTISSNTSSALPAIPPEPPAMPLAPGTVPTIPAHLQGPAFGTTEETWHLAGDAVQNGAPQNGSSEATPLPLADNEQKPSPLEPEHHPETLTDAGTRPA